MDLLSKSIILIFLPVANQSFAKYIISKLEILIFAKQMLLRIIGF